MFISILCLFATITILNAAEVDNYSVADFDQPDVTQEVNDYFNRAISKVLSKQKDSWLQDTDKVTKKIYLELKGNIIRDRFTAWAKKNLPVHTVSKNDSIYRKVTLNIAPIFAIFGVGKSINLQGIPVGLDKVSHFLGAGYIMWKRNYREGKGLQNAIDWAAESESSFLGQRITGVYSNGDLIADYEGMLFFRSLFDENILHPRGAILTIRDGRIVQQREFDIRDHFTPFWNEAILPSSFKPKVQKLVEVSIPERCSAYRNLPELYDIEYVYRSNLYLRYHQLPIRRNDNLLMSKVCNQPNL